MIPMKSTPGIKFDFAMAMGVRNGDKTRKAELDKLITTNAKKIQAIIAGYNIPLLPLTKEAVRDND
jgi:predicted amino acid racemase